WSRTAATSRPTGAGAGVARAPIGWPSSSNSEEAARNCVQALDPVVSDHKHFPGLHAGLAIGRHHVRLHHDNLARPERLLRDRTGRPALAAENRRQISAAVTVQQVVNDGEPRLLDD